MGAHDAQLVNAHKRMLCARHANREHAVAHKRGVRGAVVGQSEMQNATPDVADTVEIRCETLILDVDDGDVAVIHVFEHADFRQGVVLMRTMPGEMIGREIQEHGDARMEGLGRGELIAGELGDESLPLLAPIHLVDGRVADVADRDAVEP